MIIHLDTCVVIDALVSPFRGEPALRAALMAGHRMTLSAPALFEWLRGPRLDVERDVQEQLFPRHLAVPFNHHTAEIAERLYRAVPRPRGREMDLVIAACAIEHDAALWTLNRPDFEDIPGLRLFTP